MVVSPRSAHPFGIPVVRNDVVIVGELFVADGAYACLLSDLHVQQFPHLPRRSKFPISTRVVWIFNPLNSKPNQFGLGKERAATASQGSVDGAQFVRTQSHGIPLEKVQRLKKRLGRDEGGSRIIHEGLSTAMVGSMGMSTKKAPV
jgi:hypothetical protein